MKIQKTVRVFTYLAGLVVWLGGTALAQSPNKAESVAAISADRTAVRWQPQVEYGRLILTVSAPGGEVFRKEFEAGTTPSFKLTDQEGYSLPDGSYVYELRVVPNVSSEVRKALADSRENGNTAEVVQKLQRNGQLPASVPVQSGSFRIDKSTVLIGSPEGGTEPREPKQGAAGGDNELQSRKKSAGTVTIQDVVTADDIIVQGGACIGIDCINNELFNFVTIKLKENSTRIKFDDTSVAAGFPANDWQITVNDGGAGGANKFSIEDITGSQVPFTLTAGAPNNSLFIASTGRVGLHTATPALDLHIATGDTPAQRFEQTSDGSRIAQTWDIGGNEANFFIRDVTNLSACHSASAPARQAAQLTSTPTATSASGRRRPRLSSTFLAALESAAPT